jgi:hypothetical protein
MKFGHEQLNVAESSNGKMMLIRIVSMLTKLGKREHNVREDSSSYSDYEYDNDNEF